MERSFSQLYVRMDGWDWMGLVIIGHRKSKSTLGANKLSLHIGYVAMHYQRWKLDNDSKYAKFGLVLDNKCIQITYRKLFAPRTKQIAERSQNRICAEINWFLMKEIPQNTKIYGNILHVGQHLWFNQTPNFCNKFDKIDVFGMKVRNMAGGRGRNFVIVVHLSGS